MSTVEVNETIESINKQFDLSKTHGFLPENQTPDQLRPPYDVLVNICNELPKLIRTHEIETVIDNLKLIEIDSETTHAEYQTLYTILCLIQAAYIWHRGETNHTYFVPEQICRPLSIVSKYLGIAPILTHGAVDLYNWRLIDSTKPFELENIQSAFTLTGTRTESHFYLVMVAIEHTGRPILDEIIRLNLMENPTSDQIVRSMEIISAQLDTINSIMKKMYDHCDPDLFYNQLRIFLTGWTNAELFPNGMELRGIGTGIRYNGGSAAQSSLIQVFDAFLGVKHQSEFLTSMREYMPIKHKKFIEWVESQPSFTTLFDQLLNDQIIQLHTACVEKLVRFRSIHMGFIRHYILSEAEKNEKLNKKSVLATEGSGGTILSAETDSRTDEKKESGLSIMISSATICWVRRAMVTACCVGRQRASS